MPQSIRFERVLLTGTVAAAAYVVMVGALLGQDVTWDQRNYHYYGAWALLNGSSFSNLWPAQIQSFLNPLLSVLPYALISALPPLVASTSLALLQATNIGLLLAIASRFFRTSRLGSDATLSRQQLVVITSAVTIGATGPIFVSEIGTTLPDITTSIPVLAGVLLIMRHIERHTWAPVLIAGLLLGVATGLRLTNAVFVIGTLAYPWWLLRGRREAIKLLFVFVITFVAGVLVSYGYWSLELWNRFTSPVFPLYNSVFMSPWFEPMNINVNRSFQPSSLADALSYPFQWVIGRYPSSEVPFRDARFAVLAVLVVIALGSWLLARRRLVHPLSPTQIFLLTFVGSSFLLWLPLFGISRYLLPLELVSGIAILGLLGLITTTRWMAGFSVALAVALVVTTVPPNWGRVRWADSWYGVQVPAEIAQGHEMFVMLGGDALAYVVPYLPVDAQIVRLDGNMPLADYGRERLRGLAQQVIDMHDGPMFSMALEAPSAADIELLEQFGLRQTGAPCHSIVTRIDTIVTCPLAQEV